MDEWKPGQICDLCGHDHTCYSVVEEGGEPMDLGFCCECDTQGLDDSECSPWYNIKSPTNSE